MCGRIGAFQVVHAIIQPTILRLWRGCWRELQLALTTILLSVRVHYRELVYDSADFYASIYCTVQESESYKPTSASSTHKYYL